MDDITRRQLHDEIQAIYDRIFIATKPENILPEMAALAEEIFTNPIFEPFLQEVAKQLSLDLKPISDLKDQCYKEVIAIHKLLNKYVKHIPMLSVYLLEWDNIIKTRPPKSWELIIDLEALIIRICVLLKNDLQNKTNRYWQTSNTHHQELLKKLAVIGKDGTIIEYIFAPQLRTWHQEYAIFERKKKTALWYSIYIFLNIYILNDLKNFELRHKTLLQNNQLSAAYLLKERCQHFDEVFDANNPVNSLNTNFDIDENKLHTHRAWTVLKPTLMPIMPVASPIKNEKAGEDTLIYEYSEAKNCCQNSRRGNKLCQGKLHKGNTIRILSGNSAYVLARVLEGKINKEELGEMFSLNKETGKERVNNALGVLRKNTKKTFKIKSYISTKGSIVLVNYKTILKYNQ